MINRDELVKIGQFKKPHGIKGEIVFSFTDDSFDENHCPFFVCELDGIFVPFRVEDYRFTSGSSAYVQLKNVDSDRKAQKLSHKEIFIPKQYIQHNSESGDFSWDYFIGFTLTDESAGKIGRIIDIDDTTLNTLFIVENEKEEILIPAAEEIIVRVDENRKELVVALPEGLLSR